MVIDKLIWEGKEIDSYDGKVIDEIIFDGEVCSFGENAEASSDENLYVNLQDAVPGSMSVDILGKSEQNTYEGYNLIPYPYYYASRTIYGVNFTVNDDGTILGNGTATDEIPDNIARFYILTGSYAITLEPGTYRLSGCPEGGNPNTYHMQSTFGADYGNGLVFTVSSTASFAFNIAIYKGATINNLLFKPMLCKGNAEREWEPYVGGISSPSMEYPQPIVSTFDGGSELVVRSRNLFDAENTTTTYGSRTSVNNGKLEVWVDAGVTQGWPGFEYNIYDRDLFDTYLTISMKDWTISNVDYCYIKVSVVRNGKSTEVMRHDLRSEILKTFSMTSSIKIPKYSDGDYIAVGIRASRPDASKDSYVAMSDVMLERGTEVNDYQDYFKESITIPEGTMQLMSVGDCSDELIVDGIRGTVKKIQRTAQLPPLTDDGWFYNGHLNTTYGLNAYQHSFRVDRPPVEMLNNYDDINNISDYFIGTYSAGYRIPNRIQLGPTYIVVFTDGIESLEDFVSKWSALNPEIFYKTNMPIETDITDTNIGQALLAFCKSHRYDNVVHVMPSSGVQPKDLSVQYFKQKRPE